MIRASSAVGAIAEIDRQRIEGVTEQPRIAQQQHPPAGQVDAVLGARSVARRARKDEPSRSP